MVDDQRAVNNGRAQAHHQVIKGAMLSLYSAVLSQSRAYTMLPSASYQAVTAQAAKAQAVSRR